MIVIMRILGRFVRVHVKAKIMEAGFMSKRRTPKNIQNGFITFPVNSKEFKDTGEGGLLVTLYVLDKKAWHHRWANAMNDNPWWDDPRHFRFWKKEFSMYHEGDEKLNKILPTDEGRDVLLAMMLASTNWSGFNWDTTRVWSASSRDLTKEGKELIILLRKLYPGCRLLMLTTIDT